MKGGSMEPIHNKFMENEFQHTAINVHMQYTDK